MIQTGRSANPEHCSEQLPESNGSEQDRLIRWWLQFWPTQILVNAICPLLCMSSVELYPHNFQKKTYCLYFFPSKAPRIAGFLCLFWPVSTMYFSQPERCSNCGKSRSRLRRSPRHHNRWGLVVQGEAPNKKSPWFRCTIISAYVSIFHHEMNCLCHVSDLPKPCSTASPPHLWCTFDFRRGQWWSEAFAEPQFNLITDRQHLKGLWP